jgi:hypothetical protein
MISYSVYDDTAFTRLQRKKKEQKYILNDEKISVKLTLLLATSVPKCKSFIVLSQTSFTLTMFIQKCTNITTSN